MPSLECTRVSQPVLARTRLGSAAETATSMMFGTATALKTPGQEVDDGTGVSWHHDVPASSERHTPANVAAYMRRLSPATASASVRPETARLREFPALV